MKKRLLLNCVACLLLGFLVSCSDDDYLPGDGGGNPPGLPSLPVPEDMSLMVNLQGESISALDEHYFYFIQADTEDVEPDMERTCAYQLCRRERGTDKTEVLHKIAMAYSCPFGNLYIRDGYLYYTTIRTYGAGTHVYHGAEFWRMDTRTLQVEELAYANTEEPYKMYYTADSIFCREDRWDYFSMDYKGQGNGMKHEYEWESYNLYSPFLEYDGRYYFKTLDLKTLDDIIVSTRPDRQDLKVVYQVPEGSYAQIRKCFVYRGRVHVVLNEYDYESDFDTYTLVSFLPDGSDQRILIDRVDYGGDCSFGFAGDKLFVCTALPDPGNEVLSKIELRYVDLQTGQTRLFLTKPLYRLALNVLLEDRVVLYAVSRVGGREETYVCDLQGNCTLY